MAVLAQEERYGRARRAAGLVGQQIVLGPVARHHAVTPLLQVAFVEDWQRGQVFKAADVLGMLAAAVETFPVEGAVGVSVGKQSAQRRSCRARSSSGGRNCVCSNSRSQRSCPASPEYQCSKG